MNTELIDQLQQQGINHQGILDAMLKVDRAHFIDAEQKGRANLNQALPIDCGQTISQPYVVARMTELLLTHPRPKRVLEIGTGSGYQAAILAELVDEVFTVERFHALAESAQRHLSPWPNVAVTAMDGNLGWPEKSPFDGIIITAATPHIPQALFDQLAPNGRIVAPVGPLSENQFLCCIEQDAQGKWCYQRHDAVVFVPLLSGTEPK